MAGIKLYHGDCLNLMQQIPDGSIDAIIADPPYGTTACNWDSIIPLDLMWQQLNRIIKQTGAIVLFGSQPFTSKLICSNIEMFKYDWIWRKPKGTGHLNAKKMPMKDKEDILVFYKKQCLYNPQFMDGIPYKAKHGKYKPTTYGKYDDIRNDNAGFRYPKQILEFGVVERDNLHPTQKPVPLIEYLIKTYTNEGETVLDFTMGSGTTGVACINTNRNFIGIEQDKNYFDIASNRITDCQQKKLSELDC